MGFDRILKSLKQGLFLNLLDSQWVGLGFDPGTVKSLQFFK